MDAWRWRLSYGHQVGYEIAFFVSAAISFMEIHAMRRKVGLYFLDIDKTFRICGRRQRFNGRLGLNVSAFIPRILGMTTGAGKVTRLPGT
ncbi:MAG: hypothetical protein NTY05_06060, partial [Rhodocyclales bacterium]|nr:hypothetical protein [Rhodocyclales bacterium]